MTDTFEEFEQEQYEDAGTQSDAEAKKKSSVKNALNKPVVKLAIIVGVVGLAVAGALGAFSGDPAIKSARIASPPNIKEAPGGNVTPFFAEQNQMADKQRVEEAMANRGSAMPTPIGKSVDNIDIDALSRKSQMEEFRAETEKLRREFLAEKQQNEKKAAAAQQQIKAKKEDLTLATAMQKQLQELMTDWTPKKLKVVNGVEPLTTSEKTESAKTSTAVNGALVEETIPAPIKEVKTLLAAGTVNYAQLLTEANSDIPGPIMVQVLSGPFSGGRAIGTFQVMYEQLVLSFKTIVYKNKEYMVNAIALNPDTTLSGLATEVDHRYFKRVVLPAAASFMSGFGSALQSAGSQTTVSGDSLVITEIQKGYKEAAFEGMANAGQTVSQFLQQEGARTKTLVRVAPGTAMGLFFLASVKEDGTSSGSQEEGSRATGMMAPLARAYQESGYGEMPRISSYPGVGYEGGAPSPYERSGQAPIRTPNGSITVYK